MISWWYRASTLSPLFFCSFPFPTFDIFNCNLDSLIIDFSECHWKYFCILIVSLINFSNLTCDFSFCHRISNKYQNKKKRKEKRRHMDDKIGDRVRISSSAVIEKSSIIESLIENWMFGESKERFFSLSSFYLIKTKISMDFLFEKSVWIFLCSPQPVENEKFPILFV